MIRRFLAIAIVLLSCLCCLSAISVKDKSQEVHSFDSIPMLNTYYDETVPSDELDFWENTQVSLLTIGKDKPIYSWFGHSAILVETPTSPDMVFDYGTFSFDNEDFFINFAMGRLWFCCWGTYAFYEMDELEENMRTVSKVTLDLTTQQKKAVVMFLSTNSKAEHRTYLYHHYNDNCATRLRDIIDYATGGDFQNWAKSQPGTTFRQQASRSLVQNRFVLWALDFLQSGNIDRQNSLWEDMFLPEILEQALLEYGKVTKDREYVLDYRANSPYPENSTHAENNILFSLAVGIVLAAISFLLIHYNRRRLYNVYSSVVYIVFGLCGTLLAFMMLFTNHDVTWNNENLIYVNPALIAVVVMILCKDYKKARALNGILLLLALVLVVLKFVLPSVFHQSNWAQILTMIPLYATNFVMLNAFGYPAKSAG